MKKIYLLLVTASASMAFGQTKEITFSELTTGSGMYFGAVMTTTDITVTVQGPSDRYLAFGFGTGMANGNDAIIWSTLGTGAAPLQLRDHRMIGQGSEPSVDAQQDWTVVSNNVSGGNRTIVATRALNTGDANDVVFSFSATSQNLFWAKASSASNQLVYHGGSNRASGIVRNWVVPDVTPPAITSVIPADNTVGASVSTNLTINFSENVSWGTGSVILYDGNDNVIQTVSSGNPNATLSGSTFFYNPPANLVINTPYYVKIDATAFKDAANNFFAGIADNITWNFNTNDITPPVLVASPFVPADNSNGVAITTPLSITFNEAVQAGTGEIQLYDGSGTLVEAYDVVSSPLISISVSTVTINPTDLTMNTSYYVHIQPGAIKDLSNNNYAGFSNNTTWNFNTNDLVAPLAVTFSPADNAVNVPATGTFSITLNEDVQLAATGAVELYTSAGTLVESFNNLSPLITVTGPTVQVSTTNPLNENTAYYVLIAPGFIRDLGGNDFAGITINTDWNFTVGDFTNPTLADLMPLDNSIDVLLDVTPTIFFSEDVMLGTGSCYLVNENNATVQEFSVALGNITANLNSVVLNQSGLDLAAQYHILIDTDAVTDLAGNPFDGISDTTAWSFKAVMETGLNELKQNEYSWNGKELVIHTTYSYGELLDPTGRVVGKLEAKKTVLDNLPAGIYQVRILRNSEPAFLRIYVD